MYNSTLDIPGDQSRQLDKLIHGFKKLNGFHKVELYKVTEKEVIVGAKKFFTEMPEDEELKRYRREAIAALRTIFIPFSGGRKVHIHMKFYFDSEL